MSRHVHIEVPEQSITLNPVEEDGRWMGAMFVGGQDYRVEAYALDSRSAVVQDLITDLNTLATCGDLLRPLDIDGRSCLLAVFPKSV